MKPDFDLSLYLVLDPKLCGEYGMVATTRDAVAAGATVVQLRMKHASTQERIEMGRALKQITSGSQARLIVNDDVEAALAIDADGVHVGQSDDKPAQVRALIGPDKLLGLSVDSIEIAKNVNAEPLDYIGVGPVFATATKPDHAQPIGFEGISEIIRLVKLPAVAIGGLSREHIGATLRSGAQGVAVVSAICGQADPFAATKALADEIERARS